MIEQTQQAVFDPMIGKVAVGGGGVPVGNYDAAFEKAEYLPPVAADPMTGEGGRQWAKIVFTWRILSGCHAAEYATRETPAGHGIKSAYIQICGWLIGKQLTGGEAFDLAVMVGKKYLITVSPKLDKSGNPTAWRHVTAAVLLPQQ